MKAAPKQRAYIRMCAMRALLLDTAHSQVAAIFNIHSDTLADWVRRFNDRGIDGLIDAPRSGRPPKIAPEQTEELVDLFRHPEQVERTHWTARGFHGYITEHLDCELGYSTLTRWLHDHDFRLKVPQPWPDRQDEKVRGEFVERLEGLMNDEDIELWSMDEMGVEGDPRPRRRWAVKGEKTRTTRNGDHLRMNVMGMVCPRTGEFFAIEVSHSDSECFQAFLDEVNRRVSKPRKRNLIVLDNASWHKCKNTKWGAFEPLFLPPYSPDLNPIERLWLLIKAEWFNGYISRSREQLIARLDQALLWVIDRKDGNVKTCSFPTKL